ncbi:hypothetical protein Tco_1394119 [Tanacetum coccineum]
MEWRFLLVSELGLQGWSCNIEVQSSLRMKTDVWVNRTSGWAGYFGGFSILLTWFGIIGSCDDEAVIYRVLEPVILPSAPSQAVKQRLLNFVRSLSTVLAFAYCLSSMGCNYFIIHGVAGFLYQKWVTAGGLGTVLLTLAGREIFTNFLSSVMRLSPAGENIILRDVGVGP